MVTCGQQPSVSNLHLLQSLRLESALAKMRRDGKPFDAVYGPPLGCDITALQRAQCESYLVVGSQAPYRMGAAVVPWLCRVCVVTMLRTRSSDDGCA